MHDNQIYVPILKGKEGEYAALEALAADVKDRIAPLIEVPNVPYDYVKERTKTLDDHVAGIAQRLQRSWGPERPCFIDCSVLDVQGMLADGTVALGAILRDCANLGVSIIPVATLASSNGNLAAAGEHAQSRGTGVCLRLRVGDLAEDVDTGSEVNRILVGLGDIGREEVDLVLDIGDTEKEDVRAVMVARYILTMVPNISEWRRVALAAASFPEDLSEVDASSNTILPRREWKLWETLHRRPDRLERRDMIFGDYGIANPVIKELDPRMMRMSASIRYTTRENWLVVKGRNVKQYGFEQYYSLCQELIERPEYSGADYCWGDRYISQCAAGESGPGNATTWRKVGTNHHITLVTRQLASLTGS